MKPKHLLKITILLIAAFAFSGCSLIGIEDKTDDSDDPCKKNKLIPIERVFIPTLTATYKDHFPFSGKATFSIHKVSCDGEIEGSNFKSGNTNINGNWVIGEKFTYTFEHPDEVIIVKIDVTGKNKNGLELTHSKKYTYDYAFWENQTQINFANQYVVQLTWSSTD